MNDTHPTGRTRRPVSEAAEAVLYRPVEVLDHGSVTLIDYMGDDESIPNAARMSYGRGTRSVSDNEALLRYLIRNKHETPLEMVQAKFHVKLPIFVARQWMRHRNSYNELSARYSVLDREFYIPAPEHLAAQSRTNRQGRAEVLEGEEAARVLDLLKAESARQYASYTDLLAEEDEDRDGLTRELARMCLGTNIYTQFVWSVSARALLNFLHLRADAHAQYEIRAYATAIIDEIATPWLPITMRAFADYLRDAVSLSRQQADLMRALAAHVPDGAIDPADFGLKGRELRELMDKVPGLEAKLKG
ncbi:FAD-dependent thymidylate synthase [Palleronia sediminis]|uniref:Flavin-dependent thymidylate synthase n=1 Tax=Palleronia sediminis TaxID=2547833 RepID=A0A4R6AFE7_9RHOB|nr:FAD-dependent thymidylate synthase [Palleronia sediminis]TDL81822.1 FAD-dependent thymidylate synthase [Palleronia sediminis]